MQEKRFTVTCVCVRTNLLGRTEVMHTLAILYAFSLQEAKEQELGRLLNSYPTKEGWKDYAALGLEIVS